MDPRIRVIEEGKVGMRPTWDEYFLSLAVIIASRAACYNVHGGTVITMNNHILGTGYNGAASGIKNCIEYGGCYKEKQTGEDYSANMNSGKCIGVHSEMNALAHLTKTLHKGATVYLTIFPCTSCTKNLIAYGIKKVVFKRFYDMREAVLSLNLFQEANVEVFNLNLSSKRFLDIAFNNNSVRFDVWNYEEKKESSTKEQGKKLNLNLKR